MTAQPQKDIRYLRGVGERRAELFKKLGVDSVDALLRYFPRDYIDQRHPLAVADAPLDAPCMLQVRVEHKGALIHISGGRQMCRVDAADDSGALVLVFFNNRFTPAALEVGGEYLLYGRVSGGLTKREMINPTLVKPQQQDTLTPVYAQTAGLPSRTIAAAVSAALSLGAPDETLPSSVLAEYALAPLAQAIHDIHFPRDAAALAAARRRFAFEELLVLQLGFSLLKARNRAGGAPAFRCHDPAEFLRSLPYELTAAQRRCVAEICADLARSSPMNRLLQGDVGSGKTVVAAAAAYCAARSGLQSAFMAPTEILAAQHAETLQKLLGPFGVRVGLLTAAVKGKARTLLLQKIAAGEVDVVAGTHAVIQSGVEFRNLGFALADEQHRFGVNQRGALQQKGKRPHTLVMSATPIPRTLALIIYGELDISTIDELPAGRRPVKTLLVERSYRERYLNFVRENARKGFCSYIVCPLVEDSELYGSDVESASDYYAALCRQLGDIPSALLHGRMKPAEKSAAIERFRSGEVKVLVSTTVIEVGVDVPQATVMIIENAERFGLSQLHQLRGRIGRSGNESWCVLVSDAKNGAAAERLKLMCETSDGFKIAAADLKQRGPGDFFGSRQHGLPALSLPGTLEDERIIADSRAAATRIIAADAGLSAPQNAGLRGSVDAMFGAVAAFN